jgi:hypothetical protein
MTTIDRTTPMWRLREFLQIMATDVGGKHERARAEGYAYLSSYEFVLREGEEFEPAPCPPTMAMYPKLCFGQAIMLSATLGLPYVEGYAYPGRGFPAIQHAWNLLPDGRVLDVTWARAERAGGDPANRAYLGVRFSARRADGATWDGDASVLDDWQRGYPILREPWQGEDSPGDVTGLLDTITARAPGGPTSDQLRRAFALRASEAGLR